ncbi:MAG: hypothetical protein R6T83_09965, partial [Salinibacter sp.]
MHGGSALGIPLFYIWAVGRNLKLNWRKWSRAFIGPVLLVSVFICANLPWTSVKKVYLNDH